MNTDIGHKQTRELTVELPLSFQLSVAGLELVGIIVLAIISGNLVVFLLEKYSAPVVSTDVDVRIMSSHGVANNTDFVYLKSVDAFYPGKNVTAQTQVAQVPESTLDVQIFGIRASGDGHGTVIFKSQGSVQQLAKVGNEIAPNTIMTAIHADRIEFRRSGRLETIYLDEERTTSDLSVQKRAAQQAVATGSADDVSNFVSALSLSPYRNERGIAGFAVGSDADGTLLALSGLKVGDIITDVNGNELHSWERVTEISEGVNLGRLEVRLERHGEPANLIISTSSLGQ